MKDVCARVEDPVWYRVENCSGDRIWYRIWPVWSRVSARAWWNVWDRVWWSVGNDVRER